MRDIPVLFNRKKIQKAKLICYPIYVYRVIVPKPLSNKLNTFQNIVLRLSAAGYSDKSVIQQYTCLSLELINHITKQLFSYGLINKEGQITAKGKDELENKVVLLADLMMGYIYQDPFTLSLYPQFSDQLKYIDVYKRKENKVRLSITEEYYESAYIINESTILPPSKPEPIEIISALKNYSRDANEIIEQDMDEYNTQADNMECLKQISYLDENADKCYLTLQLYPDDSEQGWNVISPFEKNINDRKFKDILLNKANIDVGLKEYLLDINKDRLSDSGEMIQKEKELMINIITDNYIDKHGELFLQSKMKDVVINYELADASILSIQGGNNQQGTKLIKTYLGEASNLVSRFLKEILSPYELSKTINTGIISEDKQLRRNYLETIYDSFGYTGHLSDELLFWHIKKKDLSNISNIYKMNEKMLLLLAIILSYYKNTPFTAIIKNNPDIINNLLYVINIRNKKSDRHDTSVDPTIEEYQKVKTIIDPLINLYYTDISKGHHEQ